MGFIVHKSVLPAELEKTGKAIKRVAESVFKTSEGSEWKKFDADIRGWLHEHGYRYVKNATDLPTDDSRIPDDFEIVPVYDLPKRMHVRIPWAADMAQVPPPVDDKYSGNFEVFLAKYFMRKCR